MLRVPKAHTHSNPTQTKCRVGYGMRWANKRLGETPHNLNIRNITADIQEKSQQDCLLRWENSPGTKKSIRFFCVNTHFLRLQKYIIFLNCNKRFSIFIFQFSIYSYLCTHIFHPIKSHHYETPHYPLPCIHIVDRDSHRPGRVGMGALLDRR